MSSTSLVCLDTQILIWAFKKEATEGQEYRIAQATHFVSWLSQSNMKILAPTIAIAESMIKIEDKDVAAYTAILRDACLQAPFDELAGLHFAKVWRARYKLPRADGVTRQQMKADAMIVATALAHGAKRIYSNDGDVKAFAGDLIAVEDMPDVPYQLPITGQE